MSLIKQHPAVQLVMPSFAYPGDAVAAELVMDAEQELPVNRITCRLVGHETVVLQRRAVHTLCYESRVLQEGGTLAPGETRFDVTFELPTGIPPTHDFGADSKRAKVAYRMQVLIDIPWWPDFEKSFVLPVRLPPERVQDEGPSLYASHPNGPEGTEPYVEFTITAHNYLPGDVVEGVLSVANAGYNPYHSATLRLAGYELLHVGDRDEELRRKKYESDWDISELVDGAPLPFAMTLPEGIPPSFSSKLCTLEWRFEVELEVHGADDFVAMVPIRILPQGSSCVRPETSRAIEVGGGRTALLWSGVADELGLTFSDDRLALETRRGDVRVDVRRQHRGEGGLCLVAELAYPSLGLRLGGAVEDAQVGAFRQALGEALTPLELDAMEDERLEVLRRHAGQNHDQLLAFAEEVLALADAIGPARSAIPPPACMAEDVDAWKKLARSLRGKLRVADMAVFGRFEGIDVEVLTGWETGGEPVETKVVFRDPGVVAESRTLAWREGEYVEGHVEALGEATLGRIEKLLANARCLTVTTDHIILHDVRAPIRDTSVIHRRLGELSRLAAALRGQSGPYR